MEIGGKGRSSAWPPSRGVTSKSPMHAGAASSLGPHARVARRARQRRRVYQSGKGRATNRSGPGGRQAHRWPVGSARDRPRPEPRQRPGPAYGLVLLGDPPSFDEDDTDPHCCVKPLDAVALPSLAATAACRSRQGPTASCSAPTASRLRCLSTVRPGMPPRPPRLPRTPRQSRLRCRTPSPSPRAPRTFLQVSRDRRLPYLMSMSPAIGRMTHRVRSAPAARRPSAMADPCPRGCISRRSSTILAYRANCDLALGRRHPRAMAARPRRISTGCLVSQSVGMAPDHAATGRLPHGRYDSASTKAAPETTDEISHILWISKQFRAFRLWLSPHPDTNNFWTPFPPRAVAAAFARPPGLTDHRLPRRRVKGRQGARLRRAGAAWVAAVLAGRRRRCLAGSGRGAHPEVDVGRLRLGGLPVLGLAPGTARVARPAVELAFRPAGLLLGSLAAGAPASATSRRAARRILARSRHRRVSRDRRPARGRTRFRGWAGRSRRVACEPPPPVRLRSWSRPRFRARTGVSAPTRFGSMGTGRKGRSRAWPPSRGVTSKSPMHAGAASSLDPHARVARRARQRRGVYQSGKGRATNRGGPGGRPVYRGPVGNARDLPRPAPRQRPGPAYGLVLLGDPPSFDEDDTDPHCCVKPLDAVALPSRAATAACRTRQGPPASCSAPMAPRLRCLSTVRPGMPPWPPRLPHTPRQSRLRCGTPSPSPRAPRTFQKSRETAACRA